MRFKFKIQTLKLKSKLMVQLNELPPWRPYLAKALTQNRKQPDCRFFQLATIRQDGRPANRTVVFRGFFDNALQIITDIRSEKIDQLRSNPQAEACWYFTKTREQFRLAGPIEIIPFDLSQNADHDVRLDLWHRISPAAREQFSWPSPGALRHPQNAINSSSHGNITQDALSQDSSSSQAPESRPPSTFSVLHLWPERVDHLMLRGTPQKRWLYFKEPNGQWSISEVNP